MKRCPFCAEEIQDAAIVCRFCGRDVPSSLSPYEQRVAASATAAPQPPVPQLKGKTGAAVGCHACGKTVRVGDVNCSHCGAPLVAGAAPTRPAAVGRDLSPTATAAAAKPAKSGGRALGCLVIIVVGVLLLVLVAINGGGGGPSALTQEHRDAVQTALAAKAYGQPNDLMLETNGFIVATYVLPDDYVRKLSIPLRTFGQDRLLVIREALLPFGFRDYRVNINGPPPGTGLIKRYGAARFINSGSLEWITP